MAPASAIAENIDDASVPGQHFVCFPILGRMTRIDYISINRVVVALFSLVDQLQYTLATYSVNLPNTTVLTLHNRIIFSCDRLSVRLSHLFTPQPFGLEGYCHGSGGGRAGGCQTCGNYISVTAGRIFSIRSSVELSRPLVVHCHGHLPICPIWACPWAKTCKICHRLGPDFAERISLKLLDGFTPFQVLWACLDL